MGYSTSFSGSFDLNKPLAPEHAAYLRAFARSRRMKRYSAQTVNLLDPIRHAAGLPVGAEGEFYVGASDDDDFGQSETTDIIDYNRPPTYQPGLWCHWIPTADNAGIEWDGGEKFYNYIDWLAYIVKHFLKPWGYVLNGSVEWSGEENGDMGEITVENNVVKAFAHQRARGRQIR